MTTVLEGHSALQKIAAEELARCRGSERGNCEGAASDEKVFDFHDLDNVLARNRLGNCRTNAAGVSDHIANELGRCV
jgi:hypothetical protein